MKKIFGDSVDYSAVYEVKRGRKKYIVKRGDYTFKKLKKLPEDTRQFIVQWKKRGKMSYALYEKYITLSMFLKRKKKLKEALILSFMAQMFKVMHDIYKHTGLVYYNMDHSDMLVTKTRDKSFTLNTEYGSIEVPFCGYRLKFLHDKIAKGNDYELQMYSFIIDIVENNYYNDDDRWGLNNKSYLFDYEAVKKYPKLVKSIAPKTYKLYKKTKCYEYTYVDDLYVLRKTMCDHEKQLFASAKLTSKEREKISQESRKIYSKFKLHHKREWKKLTGYKPPPTFLSKSKIEELIELNTSKQLFLFLKKYIV